MKSFYERLWDVAAISVLVGCSLKLALTYVVREPEMIAERLRRIFRHR